MNHKKLLLEKKRQKALALLRKNRLKNRKDSKQRQDTSSKVQAGERIGAFFKLVKDVEIDDLLAAQQHVEDADFDVRRWIKQNRKSGISHQKQEAETDLQGEHTPVETAGGGILEEILSSHFRQNMHEWLSSIEPKEELNSTSIEDLEQHRKEILYRHKLLNAMVDATQKQLDGLDIQIRAKTQIQ